MAVLVSASNHFAAIYYCSLRSFCPVSLPLRDLLGDTGLTAFVFRGTKLWLAYIRSYADILI